MRRSPGAIAIASAALIWAATAIAGAAAGDLPKPFVYLSQIDPTIQQEMRYATPDNFVGRRVDGYDAQAQCILTRKTAEALSRVQAALRDKGYALKVYDCYRPARAVKDFVRWSKDASDQKMKRKYYPEIDKRVLFRRGFIAKRSMHSRGNTVDLTIVPAGSTPPKFDADRPLTRCDAPVDKRAPDNSLDLGTGFDCFHPNSHTASKAVPKAAREHRRLLVDAMAAQGFENYRKEWWHFQKKGAATSKAFDFPVRTPKAIEPPAPKPAAPPPAQKRSDAGCARSSGDPDAKCVGIEISVFEEPSSATEAVGTIRDFEPVSLHSCDCRDDDNAAGSQRWCKIDYNKSGTQEFPKHWVLLSALQGTEHGAPAKCTRALDN